MTQSLSRTFAELQNLICSSGSISLQTLATLALLEGRRLTIGKMGALTGRKRESLSNHIVALERKGMLKLVGVARIPPNNTPGKVRQPTQTATNLLDLCRQTLHSPTQTQPSDLDTHVALYKTLAESHGLLNLTTLLTLRALEAGDSTLLNSPGWLSYSTCQAMERQGLLRFDNGVSHKKSLPHQLRLTVRAQKLL